MKTYTETIKHLAKQAFSKYMSGANDLRVETSTIGFIYDVDCETINADIDSAFHAISNDYYSKFKATGKG
jgi:hypothetical protein